MNLDQILSENIEEIINQVKLSLESDLEFKHISIESEKEDKFYVFEILPITKSYDGVGKFIVSIIKKTQNFLWFDNSKYEMNLKIKGCVNHSWYDKDEISITDKKYHNILSKIYLLSSNEYIRRDKAEKNKQINEYIDLIKTTVKPEVKRDESINEILN